MFWLRGHSLALTRWSDPHAPFFLVLKHQFWGEKLLVYSIPGWIISVTFTFQWSWCYTWLAYFKPPHCLVVKMFAACLNMSLVLVWYICTVAWLLVVTHLASAPTDQGDGSSIRDPSQGLVEGLCWYSAASEGCRPTFWPSSSASQRSLYETTFSLPNKCDVAPE